MMRTVVGAATAASPQKSPYAEYQRMTAASAPVELHELAGEEAWSDKPGVQEGGSCYNCHRLSPKVEAFGTLGPNLAGFGKIRGNRPEIQRYVYGKIYNAKAYNACSSMQQINDLVALLLDPASPVNQ